jgi:flagellar biosynthesis protein
MSLDAGTTVATRENRSSPRAVRTWTGGRRPDWRVQEGRRVRKATAESLKNAVALAYSQTDAAPRVVAKGRGLVAEQIIARAHEHGVYVHESAELVSLLMQVDLDQRIPPQLYLAVAELLAWLYRLENGSSRRPAPLLTAPTEEKPER